MAGWILAIGKQTEQILSEVTAAGATSIAVPGAHLIFTPGWHLFISEAAGGEGQWLGKALAVSAQAVRFARPLAASKNSGARLWHPAASLDVAASGTLPEQRQLETGVAVERTLGGQYFAVQLAEARESARLTLSGLTPRGERELLDWLAAHTAWGLQPFALISPEGALLSVRLAGEPITRQRLAGERLAVTLTLFFVAEEVWP